MDVTPSNSMANTTDPPYSLAYGELVFGATLVIIISISGIIGNTMIIFSTCISRKLRTSTNVFVVSLGVADLLTCLFLPWFAVALLGKNGWALPYAEWLCGMSAIILYICTGVGLYNLAAIAVNRLLYLTRPFQYKTIYKPLHVFIMVALTWVIPGGFILSFIVAGIGQFGYETVDYPSCSDFDDVPGADTFNIAQTLIAFPFPIITIIVCYSWIYVHIKRYFNRRRNRKLELSQYDRTIGRFSRSVEDLAEIDQQELEITKYLFVVVCAFFVRLLPLFIGNAIPNNEHYNYYATLPTLANSSFNFFIYIMWHISKESFKAC